MGLADLAPGTNAERVRNHWWWRPGWSIGRGFYTWHITFDDADQLHAVAARYREALADLPNITLVPDRWLHLTMQGVGFTDEVAESDLGAIVEAAGVRLAEVEPVTVQLGPVVVGDEAVALPVQPDGPVRAIRAAIRAAIADVWGASRVPEHADRFRPHVSVAYLGEEGPAAPYVEAVAQIRDVPAYTRIATASLIRLNRDRQMYEWDTYATVSLGTA
jgi:2'-5' RNA ligase